MIIGTSPAPYGAKTTIENAVNNYPWLGCKVVGSFSLPNYYATFKDGAIIDGDLQKALEAEVQKLQDALNQWIKIFKCI